MKQRFAEYMGQMPVVAIIRGVTPDDVVEIGGALIRGGIRIIEVPLNSPDAFTSIRRLTDAHGGDCITGAGTVLTADDVGRVKDAGGTIIVTPNSNPDVIKRTVEEGLIPLPGFSSATEAFSAYAAGARYLKLFPASSFGPGHVKALRAVLPGDVKILAVGGVNSGQLQPWIDGGIKGFGVGGELYRPGDGSEAVYENALKWKHAISEIS